MGYRLCAKDTKVRAHTLRRSRFTAHTLRYGPEQVGYLLSVLGVTGIAVQGVLVRVVVARLAEERTLLVAMVRVPHTRRMCRRAYILSLRLRHREA